MTWKGKIKETMFLIVVSMGKPRLSISITAKGQHDDGTNNHTITIPPTTSNNNNNNDYNTNNINYTLPLKDEGQGPGQP